MRREACGPRGNYLECKCKRSPKMESWNAPPVAPKQPGTVTVMSSLPASIFVCVCARVVLAFFNRSVCVCVYFRMPDLWRGYHHRPHLHRPCSSFRAAFLRFACSFVAGPGSPGGYPGANMSPAFRACTTTRTHTHTRGVIDRVSASLGAPVGTDGFWLHAEVPE